MRKPPPEPPAGLAAASPGEWMKVWARVRASPSVKLVGAMAATYFADYITGADIRPGTRLLAAVCGEMNERTVKVALTQIREWGLIWRYSQGSKHGRRGLADEYRLTIPDHVLITVPMLSPDLEIPAVDNPTGSGDLRTRDLRTRDLSAGTGDLRYPIR